MQRSLVELIAAKRDGRTLEAGDMQRLITAFGSGELADYQMAALLMAVFFRGLDDAETVALTDAMLHSGSVLDLAGVPALQGRQALDRRRRRQGLDLPRAARRRVRRRRAMVSGRGLGHTGGTLDKLEAIPGFRTELAADGSADRARGGRAA